MHPEMTPKSSKLIPEASQKRCRKQASKFTQNQCKKSRFCSQNVPKLLPHIDWLILRFAFFLGRHFQDGFWKPPGGPRNSKCIKIQQIAWFYNEVLLLFPVFPATYVALMLFITEPSFAHRLYSFPPWTLSADSSGSASRRFLYLESEDAHTIPAITFVGQAWLAAEVLRFSFPTFNIQIKDWNVLCPADCATRL